MQRPRANGFGARRLEPESRRPEVDKCLRAAATRWHDDRADRLTTAERARIGNTKAPIVADKRGEREAERSTFGLRISSSCSLWRRQQLVNMAPPEGNDDDHDNQVDNHGARFF